MKRTLFTYLALSFLAGTTTTPAIGQSTEGGIALGDSNITGWATQLIDFQQGENVEDQFSNAELALGPAEGNVMDIVSLGPGGSIVLGFDSSIVNGEGWDFAVFENSFGDLFLELAYVEVSQDGANWFRFPNVSLTPDPVSAFGLLRTEDVSGLAGKYRAGFGTPFDLADLEVNLAWVQYVRVIDVVGDGSAKDSNGNPIYDPYPTIGSAGFDLDAVAVRHSGSSAPSLSAEVRNGALILSWAAQEGVTYRLERSTNGSTWTTEATITAEGTTASIQLSAPTGPAFYRLEVQ